MERYLVKQIFTQKIPNTIGYYSYRTVYSDNKEGEPLITGTILMEPYGLHSIPEENDEFHTFESDTGRKYGWAMDHYTKPYLQPGEHAWGAFKYGNFIFMDKESIKVNNFGTKNITLNTTQNIKFTIQQFDGDFKIVDAPDEDIVVEVQGKVEADEDNGVEAADPKIKASLGSKASIEMTAESIVLSIGGAPVLTVTAEGVQVTGKLDVV
jgi:hypothetical protein